MPRIRYEVATGKVNLIVDGDKTKEMPVYGMEYIKIDKYPWFDRERENLYILNGRLIAVDETHSPPLHRILE